MHNLLLANLEPRKYKYINTPLHYFQISDDGLFSNLGSAQFLDTLDRDRGGLWEYSITSGLKRFSLKSEVTICQCVVSVLVVVCQIVSSIIRARGGERAG